MFDQIPDTVKIVEVGPRDGLQNESGFVQTADKLSFIHQLREAGISTVEVTSFVRPDKIPQMADGKELFSLLSQSLAFKGESFPVLVPNRKGLEDALAVGATHFALLTATSETFSQKNTNASIAESLERIAQIVAQLSPLKHQLRGYISTVFGCPYEGAMRPGKAIFVVEKLLEMGISEISLGDTIGVATPKQVDDFLREIKKQVNPVHLALHFHDTRGMAMANILVGLEHDVRIYDSSAGGLGGCPYAPGAKGNVATEDVVYLMDSLGIVTGIDLAGLMKAASFMLQKMGRPMRPPVHHLFFGK